LQRGPARFRSASFPYLPEANQQRRRWLLMPTAGIRSLSPLCGPSAERVTLVPRQFQAAIIVVRGLHVLPSNSNLPGRRSRKGLEPKRPFTGSKPGQRATAIFKPDMVFSTGGRPEKKTGDQRSTSSELLAALRLPFGGRNGRENVRQTILTVHCLLLAAYRPLPWEDNRRRKHQANRAYCLPLSLPGLGRKRKRQGGILTAYCLLLSPRAAVKKPGKPEPATRGGRVPGRVRPFLNAIFLPSRGPKRQTNAVSLVLFSREHRTTHTVLAPNSLPGKSLPHLPRSRQPQDHSSALPLYFLYFANSLPSGASIDANITWDRASFHVIFAPFPALQRVTRRI
jgi:hypothetical protein